MPNSLNSTLRQPIINMDQEESQLRALVDAIPGYVSWFDRDLRYLGVNRRLTEDYKVPESEFIGHKIGFFGQDSNPNMAQVLQEFFDSSLQSKQTTLLLNDKDGTPQKRFLMCMQKYSNNERALIVGIDTTESWHVEAAAQRDRQIALNASRLSQLGEMAGSISHEVINPASVIQSLCEKLSAKISETNSNSESLPIIERIENTSQRIVKIVRGLLAFARDGSQDPMEATSLRTLVSDMIAVCEQRFQKYGVKIEVSDIPNTIRIQCRQVQIGQVLVNMVNNAFDAVSETENPWVKINYLLEPNSKFVEISITDSGNGIPQEVVQKMMNPFYTTKPKGKGTGLGLSIACTILADHGGSLHYDATSPNTRFVIKLPHL